VKKLTSILILLCLFGCRKPDKILRCEIIETTSCVATQTVIHCAFKTLKDEYATTQYLVMPGQNICLTDNSWYPWQPCDCKPETNK
jgi:hypothetical protein